MLKYNPILSTEILSAAAIFVIFLKISFGLVVPPNGDEAYYWLWGQHVQLSYVDHAPMVGWGAALGFKLFSWTLLGLRFQTFATQAATLAVFWFWSREIDSRNTSNFFWSVTLVYVTSPLLNFVTMNAFPDNCLVLFSLVSIYLFSKALSAWSQGEGPRVAMLYAGTVALGLAGLSKYNAIFLGLALAIVIFSNPSLRDLRRSPHLYLAGLCALAITSPVFIWNAAHHFPSVRWHMAERYSGSSRSGLTPFGLVQVSASILAVSPFLILPFFRSLQTSVSLAPDAWISRITFWTFALSSSFMLALSSWARAAPNVALHWNIMALLGFMLLTPLYLTGRRMYIAHVAVGCLLLLYATVFYVSNPVITHAVGRPPVEAPRYGYAEAATAARDAKRRYNADFIAFIGWNPASHFAFGAGTDADLYPVEESNQFKYWTDPETLKGKNAIFVANGLHEAKDFQLPFKSLAPIGTVTAKRFGLPIADFTLFFATDYQGE